MLTETKAPVVSEQKREKRGTKIIPAILCVSLSVLATLPFFFMGYNYGGGDTPLLRMPITHDMPLQLEQMKSFYNGLASGEIYPRWEEDTNRGYGAPTTSYYPPGLYYLTSASYWLSGDWTVAILLAHLIMMVAAAAAFYFYARRAMNRSAATLAMAAYIFLPYHLIDQYQRGAMAELMGFIWMPLILLFAERLISLRAKVEDYQETGNLTAISHEPDRRRASNLSKTLLAVAGLAACYSAFVWSHPPTAYQFTLAFGAFALAYALRRGGWKGLFIAGGAIAIGLAMSAYYLYPAAVEQDLIRHQYVEESWPYHDSYVFVYAEPYATAHRGFFNLIDGTWAFNTILIAAAALALLALRARPVRMTAGLRGRVIAWTSMGCLASIMMTTLSYPIGRFIPKIEIGVFSWRMLSITTFVLALLAGACAQAAINALKDERRRGRMMFGSLTLFIVIGGFAFSMVAVVVPKALNPMFVPSKEHINLATIPQTAPRYIEDLTQRERAALEGGKGKGSIERWDPEHRALKVELSGPDRLRIRTFNFPGWTATVDGRRADIITGEERGEIIIELSAGSHSVRLDYLDTPPRRAGRIVTISSFILLMAMALAGIAMRARNSSGAPDRM